MDKCKMKFSNETEQPTQKNLGMYRIPAVPDNPAMFLQIWQFPESGKNARKHKSGQNTNFKQLFIRNFLHN